VEDWVSGRDMNLRLMYFQNFTYNKLRLDGMRSKRVSFLSFPYKIQVSLAKLFGLLDFVRTLPPMKLQR
jgi:hypothetical protein